MLVDFWALEFSGVLWTSDMQVKKKKRKDEPLALYIAREREREPLQLKNSRKNAGRQIHASPLDGGDIKLSGVNGRAS